MITDKKYLSYRKKLLVSHVRGGDFSHPGEVEAIEKILQYIEKKDTNLLLDVGCGLGGTAHYIKTSGYGTPVCIDLDKRNINYATTKYPDIEFHCCDILNSETIFKDKKFNIIYLISSFLLFEKQQESLAVLAKLGAPDSTLVLFDYTFPTLDKEANFTWTAKNYTPINLLNIENTLLMSGWQLTNYIDLSNDFSKWYLDLREMIDGQKEALINKFGLDAYNSLFATYDFHAECYKSNQLGGCIILAKRV